MSGYTLLRVFHNYWRWIVIVTALYALYRAATGLIRRRDWSAADNRAGLFFVSAVDLQVLFGLVLYFAFSPFFTALRASFGAAMKSRATRFFAVEHEVAMLLALVAAHVGRVLAKKRADSPGKHRAMLVALIIFVVLVGWATPWPGRETARPLLRLSW